MSPRVEHNIPAIGLGGKPREIFAGQIRKPCGRGELAAQLVSGGYVRPPLDVRGKEFCRWRPMLSQRGEVVPEDRLRRHTPARLKLADAARLAISQELCHRRT